MTWHLHVASGARPTKRQVLSCCRLTKFAGPCNLQHFCVAGGVTGKADGSSRTHIKVPKSGHMQHGSQRCRATRMCTSARQQQRGHILASLAHELTRRTLYVPAGLNSIAMQKPTPGPWPHCTERVPPKYGLTPQDYVWLCQPDPKLHQPCFNPATGKKDIGLGVQTGDVAPDFFLQRMKDPSTTIHLWRDLLTQKSAVLLQFGSYT